MIQKLDEETIKRIAAGEVIQKIYNAVKELIENAIDAKSDNIQIYFKEYGLELIKLIDNGSGINNDDLSLATTIHATSKTSNNDEFFGLSSFGFRGEALASIDAVSDLYIESNNLMVHKGHISDSNVKKGTIVTIKNIFKNLPGRMKFIKNPYNEFKYVKELIKKYIIQHNEIHWEIIHNDKTIWNFPITTIENRIESVFKETPIFYKEERNDFKTEAYILKKTINFSAIFVNKRPIKDRIISKYIESLFKEYTFINEKPGYILFITIDHIFVDYNVHPSKEEIKFFNYNEILEAIYNIFSMQTLAAPLNSNFIYESHPIQKVQNFEFQPQTTTYLNENFEITTKLPKYTEIMLDNPIENSIKIFGQFQESFILFEKDNQLGIFDQHAVHERHIYEDMKNNMQKTQKQTLLTPIKLNLNQEQIEYLTEQKNTMQKFQFEMNNNIIFSIPVFFKDLNIKEFFENLQPPYDFKTELNRQLANIACKQAIKANHHLNIQEMEILLKNALNNPPICNHGRPVFKYFARQELEKFFKRT